MLVTHMEINTLSSRNVKITLSKIINNGGRYDNFDTFEDLSDIIFDLPDNLSFIKIFFNDEIKIKSDMVLRLIDTDCESIIVDYSLDGINYKQIVEITDPIESNIIPVDNLTAKHIKITFVKANNVKLSKLDIIEEISSVNLYEREFTVSNIENHYTVPETMNGSDIVIIQKKFMGELYGK